MKYTKEDLISFIKECTPQFDVQNGQYNMFTICTQHIHSYDIEELLEYGIERWKKVGNKSPLVEWVESIEL